MTMMFDNTSHLGVEACAEIVSRYKGVVVSYASFPEQVFSGDEFQCGVDKSAHMDNRWNPLIALKCKKRRQERRINQLRKG